MPFPENERVDARVMSVWPEILWVISVSGKKKVTGLQ